VVLLSFGRAPTTRVTNGQSWSLHFDLISCLGIGMGAYALLFFARRFRTVRALGALRLALGAIGGAGLVVHAVMAIGFPRSSTLAPPGAGGNAPLSRTGPEQWQIDGKTYDIGATYVLRFSEGLQYTIEHPCVFPNGPSTMTKDEALAVAFPLMRHAYEKGLHRRVTVRKLGEGEVEMSWIGVVLFEHRGTERVGYRVSLGLDEIRDRIQQLEGGRPAEGSP